ncbi:MAG: hypothetical protein PSW75_03625 [bacterium]|nr:hypothetical protein [bacterium]MDI1336805.1 hypothetical protein [Lacunisphaera sp.]
MSTVQEIEAAITSLPRAETREQRLRTTIAWATEGRKRNWKYENC